MVDDGEVDESSVFRVACSVIGILRFGYGCENDGNGLAVCRMLDGIIEQIDERLLNGAAVEGKLIVES